MLEGRAAGREGRHAQGAGATPAGAPHARSKAFGHPSHLLGSPCMNPSVYVETTIVSYLTARATSDVERQAQQVATRRWWEERRSTFALYTSQFVLDEAAAGDAGAATERLQVLNNLDLLLITREVEPLAAQLLAAGALPAKARVDSL